MTAVTSKVYDNDKNDDDEEKGRLGAVWVRFKSAWACVLGVLSMCVTPAKFRVVH